MKRIITTDKAPAAIGPYSQAVEADGTLYLSGMLAIDPATGEMAGDTAEAQTRQIMANIAALLAAEGLGLENIVKSSIFLTDLGAFGAVNAVYGAAFSKDPPARSCFEVAALPKGGLVEIECIARR
ncbi:MAG: RidA family protein [Clostridia bacterium]|nr:RidA family protein [Clostridia bacterium]